jgi:hypothetical protein
MRSGLSWLSWVHQMTLESWVPPLRLGGKRLFRWLAWLRSMESSFMGPRYICQRQLRVAINLRKSRRPITTLMAARATSSSVWIGGSYLWTWGNLPCRAVSSDSTGAPLSTPFKLHNKRMLGFGTLALMVVIRVKIMRRFSLLMVHTQGWGRE